MSSRSKLAAVVVVAAFLAQPLLAATACWQMAAARGSCGGDCPMPQQKPQPAPVNAVPTVPACCEISSTAPAPVAPVTVSPKLERAPILLAAVSSPAPVELEATPAPPASPPRHAGAASLSALYCIFLI